MYIILEVLLLIIVGHGITVYLIHPKEYLESLNKEVNDEEIKRLKNSGYGLIVLFVLILLGIIYELVINYLV